MANAVAKVSTLREMLEKSKAQIQQALPRHMDADKMARVAMTSIQNTPALLECDPKTVLGAVMEAAQLGLEPDGVLGHAYLVPYKRKCTLIVGYKGMIALAYRSGQVLSLKGNVVYETDEFEVAFGIDEKLKHVPDYESKKRGNRVCTYAIAHMKDGGHAFVVLSMHEVEAHRKKSASANSPAWKDHYDAMAIKTAVRVLARWIPQCPELQQAGAREDSMEGGADPDGLVIDITEDQDDNRTDQVARKIKGDADKPKAEDKPKADKAPDPDDDGEAV